MGTTVVGQTLVDRLEAEARQADARLDELTARLNGTEAFAQAALPLMLTGQAAGARVVLITQEGVDATAISEGTKFLGLVGAEVIAELWVTPRMAATDEEARAELAEVLGEPGSVDARSLTQKAALRVARSIAAPGPPSEDVLAGLLTRGFLVSKGSSLAEGDLEEIARNEAIVVVYGSSEEPTVPSEDFMVPLVRRLATEGAPVVAAENSTNGDPFVSLLREDSEGVTQQFLVTVDNLDQGSGAVAMALGLEDLVAGGSGGSYGIRGDASSMLPRR